MNIKSRKTSPRSTAKTCQESPQYSPTLQAVTTTQVFHVTNDRGEHSFHDTKKCLLDYLAHTDFKAVSVVIEEVPLKFAFGR